jgi:RNA polymerase sigma-B factor
MNCIRVTSRPKSEYADVTDMFRHLATLDEQSREYRRQRDAIIERCLPIADHIARRFRNRGEPLEDLVQVARIGLIQAVNRFDAGNGADFLAFAVPTVMGEVRRYFRDHGWSVKVPRRLKDLGSQLKRSREELTQQLGRAPTATEIADYLAIDREEVVQAQIAQSAYVTASSDAPGVGAGGDERPSLIDGFGGLDANLDKVIDVETVRPLLKALPECQQTVLMLRFFENMTQTQIAERLGVSQMHVSRLLARSLATLRERAEIPPPVCAQRSGRALRRRLTPV